MKVGNAHLRLERPRILVEPVHPDLAAQDQYELNKEHHAQ
jgi:hypothetical protein